jgi:alanine racemase
MKGDRAWACIDLDRISTNLSCARDMLPSRRILAVVKADAYGHGAISVCKRLQEDGIDYLGVGTSREALDLRAHGITAPILVLGALIESELDSVMEQDITVTIHSPGRIAELEKLAQNRGKPIPVHLLVDTGMSRLGVSSEHAAKYAQIIEKSPWLHLEGLGTHLSTPRSDEIVHLQKTAFRTVLNTLQELGIHPPFIHVDASKSALRCTDPDFNMVRLGGWIYGILPKDDTNLQLSPALSLHSQIVYLRDHTEGRSIGYGGTFVTKRDSRLATISIGYHDGLPTSLSNKGFVIVRGTKVPVVGRVTMDYTTIDVTDVPGVEVGDFVTLLGEDNGESIRAEELAHWCNLVPYEVTCLLGRRITRVPVSQLEDKVTDQDHLEVERG